MDKLTGSLVRLAAAFPRDHVPESTITLYRSKLDRCEPDVLAISIEKAISNATAFPTISELKQDYYVELRRHQESTKPELPIGRAPMPASVRQQIQKLHQKMDERAAEMEPS